MYVHIPHVCMHLCTHTCYVHKYQTKLSVTWTSYLTTVKHWLFLNYSVTINHQTEIYPEQWLNKTTLKISIRRTQTEASVTGFRTFIEFSWCLNITYVWNIHEIILSYTTWLLGFIIWNEKEIKTKEIHLQCLYLVLIKFKQLQSREPAYSCAKLYSIKICRT